MPQEPSKLEQLLIQRAIQDKLHSNPQPVPGQLPPRPATFQPDPLVVGTGLARQAHRVFNLAPELKNKVSMINRGPTKSTIPWWSKVNEVLGTNKNSPDMQDPAGIMQSGVVGLYDPELSKELWVGPQNGEYPEIGYSRWRDPKINDLSTLLHEMSHAAGYPHSSGVPAMMDQYGVELQGYKPPKKLDK